MQKQSLRALASIHERGLGENMFLHRIDLIRLSMIHNFYLLPWVVMFHRKRKITMATTAGKVAYSWE